MVENDHQLKSAIGTVNVTMRACRQKLTNRTLLRNLTPLNTLLYNQTRSCGKHLMLKRFLDLRDDFVRASDITDGGIAVPQGL